MKKINHNIITKAGIYTIACLLFFLLKSCAIPMAPTGGPKDVVPPKVLKTSPANFSTEFKGKKMYITFDEYTDLNNPGQEVIITPSLKKFPDMSIRKKTLTIDLQENELKENTTYSIQFGNALKDLNEGNILTDFNYVLSTGSYIDSLFIAGAAMNAENGLPIKGVKVMLYRDIKDSAIYKRKPEYFARTLDNGSFSINNLPKDSFFIFAVNDKNENYLLDGDEEVAFLPSKVKTDTGIFMPLNLQLSMPESDLEEIKRYSFTPPLFTIRIAKKADSLVVLQNKNNVFTPFSSLYISQNKDSVAGWITNLADTTGLKLRVIVDKTTIDTTLSPQKDYKTFLKPVIRVESGADVYNSFNAPVAIRLNLPVSRVTKDKILLLKDSTPVKDFETKFTDSTKTISVLNWKFDPAANYRIIFLPGAIKTIYGTTNDSIESLTNVPDRKNYGYLSIDVTVDNQYPYIFQFIDNGGKVIFEKRITSSQAIEIPYVAAGNYRMRLVEDRNRNGRWDAGNIITEKQPENLYYNPEELRVKANWEMTGIKFDLSKIKK